MFMLRYLLLLISVGVVFGRCQHAVFNWKFPETPGAMLIIYGIKFESEGANNVAFDINVHNAGGKKLCRRVKKGELKPQGGWISAYCTAGKLEGTYGSLSASGLDYCGDKIDLIAEYKPKPTAAPKPKPKPKPGVVPAGNLARGKPTWQTGIGWNGQSSRGVDGNTNTNYWKHSCTHTDMRTNPYWAVDLGKSYPVKGVSITNRADCCSDRLKNYDVVVTNTRPSGTTPVYGTANICIHRSTHHSGTLLMKCTRQVSGRYVMVRMKYRQYLTLCEVEVFGKLAKEPSGNVGRGKPTWQTGIGWNGQSSRAVDGNTNTNYWKHSCTHTDMRTNPYWAVDLGKSYAVTGVSITNRGDCCSDRLKNYDVVVTNTRPSGTTPVYGTANICIHRSTHHSGTLLMKCTRQVSGRYVMVRMKYRQYLTLCEVQVHV